MASMEPKRVLKPVNSSSQATSTAEQQLSHLKKLREEAGTAATVKPTSSAPPAGRSGGAAESAAGPTPKMSVHLAINEGL